MSRPPVRLSLRTPAPLVRLLLALSATTGMVDAAGILGMERVFAANMAGNLVFAALAVAGSPGFALAPCLAALAAFMAGAMAAGRIGRAGAVRPGHWLVRAAVAESALLILAGLLALWLERAGALPGRAILAVIAVTAGAAGFRGAMVRQLGVPDLSAGVLSGRGGTLMFFVGATAGAVLVLRAGLGVALLATGMIVLGATLVFVRHPQMSEIERP